MSRGGGSGEVVMVVLCVGENQLSITMDLFVEERDKLGILFILMFDW